MPGPIFTTDPYDRRVLLVSDKNDNQTYKPIHHEDGDDFTAEDPGLPVMLVDDDAKYRILRKSDLGGGGGGGAVTIADGADVNQGATTDAANTTGAAGTMSGKLRGWLTILASVWDSVNGRLKVDGSDVTQPVSIAASVPAAAVHGEVLIGGVSHPIKWVAVNSTTASTTVVAAVVGKKIRVVAFNLVPSGNANVGWNSGATPVIFAQALGPRVDYTRNYLPHGWWMETAVGEALLISQAQTTKVQVRGAILYIEVA